MARGRPRPPRRPRRRRAVSRRTARGGGGQRKRREHAVVHRPSTHAAPCKKRRVAAKKKAHALVPPSSTPKAKMSPLDTAHALLHPAATGTCLPGLLLYLILRPGDTKPHIDFMLPDGTLDCRFDSATRSIDGRARRVVPAPHSLIV